MSPDDYAKLRAQLVLHEGRRLYPYINTAGKQCVGVGYNISDRGLTDLHRAIARNPNLNDLIARGLTSEEVDRVLDADIKYFEGKIRQFFPGYEFLNSVRQRALIDFGFNPTKQAPGFQKTICALYDAVNADIDEDVTSLGALYYDRAALEITLGLWATQTNDTGGRRFERAERLCAMIRTGKDLP